MIALFTDKPHDVIYRNLSKPDSKNQKFPYLLRGLNIDRPNMGLVCGHKCAAGMLNGVYTALSMKSWMISIIRKALLKFFFTTFWCFSELGRIAVANIRSFSSESSTFHLNTKTQRRMPFAFKRWCGKIRKLLYSP